MTAPILQRIVSDRLTRNFPNVADGTASPEEVDRADRFVHAEMLHANRVEQTAKELARLAMGQGTKEPLVAILSIEHRTILGQIAAALCEAVMATTDNEHLCLESHPIPHPRHDLRLTCQTIIGAATVANQPTF